MQNKIFRATGDPTAANLELLIQAFPIVGVYGVMPRLLPRGLHLGVPDFFYAVVESNLIVQNNNEVNGMDDSSSGGTSWLADPGLQSITQNFVFEGAIQLPVVQNLNGNALENDFITTLSIRMNI